MLNSREVQLLARDALARGEEEAVLPTVAAAARQAASEAALWQWTALLQRSLDRRAEAIEAITIAAKLAPGDPRIAHGRARILLEAGLPAADAFAAALRLAPYDAEVIAGASASLLALGRAEAAEALLEETVRRHPGWVGGHDQLARLRWQMGDRNGATRSLETALAGAPRDTSLWGALLMLLIHAERFAEARAAARRAMSIVGPKPVVIANDATAASELREDDDADRAFAMLARIDEPSLAARHMRHLLRTGRPRDALARGRGVADATLLWPYRQAAWRLLDDPLADWLEGDDRLVMICDIAEDLPPLDRLADLLRGLHVVREQQIDQSVRGGTQTDGALLARIEPDLIQVRRAVDAAVTRYIAQLPAQDPRHPTLGHRRDQRVRFAGSWSVRLRASGHHANHVHPSGWISSALYVALPDGADDRPGWLTLGEPQRELNLTLSPTREIEPRPGRLVLFPSTMWHGTRPFAAGERLTIAFDIAAPGKRS